MTALRPSLKKAAMTIAVFVGCACIAIAAFGFDAVSLMVGIDEGNPWPGTYPFDTHKIGAKMKKHHPPPLFQHFWRY